MRRSIKILEKSCFRNQIWDEEDFHTTEGGDTSSKSKIYECMECEETYPNIKWFARHVYAHTFVKQAAEDLGYICSDCGKDFDSKMKVDNHIKRSKKCLNEPKVVFPCTICKKLFTRKDNLRDHLRVHAGYDRKRRKYDCKKCKMSFGGTSLLAIHMRSHTGSKPFACKVCRKTFMCNAALKKHARLHTGTA